MTLTQQEIAESFSMAAFEKTYDYLSENIEWKVIKNFECKGKSEVMQQCEKISQYFASITTNFKLLAIVEQYNKVVITGTAQLSRDGKRIEFISSCDVYEFSTEKMLQKITSYCLVEKN